MKNLIRFDWAIKRLLRNKANFGILEGFLSELLEEDIKIENILESESNKETADNKLNRVDMLVKNATGELMIIEVQNNYQADYLLRMLFGTSKLIVDNMDEGMPYSKVKKVISIHIVYFDLGIGSDYVYYGTTNFLGKHKNDLLLLSKQEQELFLVDAVSKIYPQYYIIKVNDFDSVAKDTLDEWINFLKTQEINDNTQAKGLKEAKEKLNYLQLTEEEKREYQHFIENWRDNEGIIVGNYNKGKYEGREEGRYETKIEVAKTCMAEGMSIAITAKLTGLTEDEVRDIKL
jgi:predicted transposase/invertase (TIGR01784 family)